MTSIFWYLVRKIRRRIPALAVLCLSQIGSALFGVWFALGTKNIINAVPSGGDALMRACITQALIISGILSCLFLSRWLHDRLAADLDRDWKRDLLGGLLRGDYAKISAFHSGELVNRLHNDVRILTEGLLSTLPGLASMLTRLVGVIAALSAMTPGFTLVLLSLGVVVILVTGLARRRLKLLHKEVSAAEGRVSGLIQELLEKLLLVQAMDVEDEAERRADDLLRERYRLQRRRRGVSLIANTMISTLSYLSGFVALVFCSWQMLAGVMSFGELTAVTQLVSQLQGPMVNLSGFFPKYVAMTAALERLMELDELSQDASTPAEDPWPLYRDLAALRAEGLSFSYGRENAEILRPSDFTLPKGAFAVIVGPSGVGKSTLLRLLLGIFPPHSGTLSCVTALGGTHPLSRRTRRLFAYVPQGNLLFSGTLRENLALVRPDAGEEEIAHAVRVSCMDGFLGGLPQGLDTPLGENAHGLSEGQAQRLSIARAVLSGAPVLLLDECTSALDEDTEREVLSRLSALPGRTILAVTHRPAARDLATHELRLTDGVIRCQEL